MSKAKGLRNTERVVRAPATKFAHLQKKAKTVRDRTNVAKREPRGKRSWTP